jgi:hypothetical protein
MDERRIVMRELTEQILSEEKALLKRIKELERENAALKAKLNGEPIDPLDLGIPNINFSLAKNWSYPKDDRLPIWKQERIERGFDNTELWNLDCVIARFIVPRLEEYLRQTDGFIIWQNGEDKMIKKALEALKLYSEDRVIFSEEENKTITEGFEALPQILGRLWY